MPTRMKKAICLFLLSAFLLAFLAFPASAMGQEHIVGESHSEEQVYPAENERAASDTQPLPSTVPTYQLGVILGALFLLLSLILAFILLLRGKPSEEN